jgi:hypothetical protein
MTDDSLTEAEAEELFNTGVMRKDLVALGERTVRDKLQLGEFGEPGTPRFAAVSAWIADAEFARLELDSAKRDAREAKMLAWTRWAAIAAIVAAIAAIVAAIE